MSVDTRAHIASNTPQERAVLRRTTVPGTNKRGHYSRRAGVAVKGHAGDEVRVSLEDLGTALRVLGVRPADLGYPPPRAHKKP